MRRKRIVLSAYACRPGAGSEPGVGWNIAVQLSMNHDVWVVTRCENRPFIERKLAEQVVPNLHFIYHDIPAISPLKRIPGGVPLYHYLWQLTVFWAVEPHHRLHQFNLAHQLTYGSFRYPSSLGRLGIPYIMGPVGGGEEAPVALWKGLGLGGIATEAVRQLSNLLTRFDPFVRKTYREAAMALVVSPATEAYVRLIGARSIRAMPSIGVSSNQLPKVTQSEAPLQGQEVKLLFVARLVHWKGAHLAVQALHLALQEVPSISLTILGKGPATRQLADLIRQLSLEKHVSMIETLPTLDDVYHLYATHDVFLFPSLREAGGMAVIEAMGAGLPVVCLDLGGPGLSVTPATGIRVSPGAKQQVLRDLAGAIVRLARNPELRRQMGRAGRSRVLSEFSWDRKAEDISIVYEKVLENSWS